MSGLVRNTSNSWGGIMLAAIPKDGWITSRDLFNKISAQYPRFSAEVCKRLLVRLEKRDQVIVRRHLPHNRVMMEQQKLDHA